ncbi:MAG: hypothetical protein V2A73_01925 [Pseudomonadota bacterium]
MNENERLFAECLLELNTSVNELGGAPLPGIVLKALRALAAQADGQLKECHCGVAASLKGVDPTNTCQNCGGHVVGMDQYYRSHKPSPSPAPTVRECPTGGEPVGPLGSCNNGDCPANAPGSRCAVGSKAAPTVEEIKQTMIYALRMSPDHARPPLALQAIWIEDAAEITARECKRMMEGRQP